MVTNVPLHLRSERELEDYFMYYLSRPPIAPAVLSSRPGFFNKLATFIYNRTKRILDHVHHVHRTGLSSEDDVSTEFEPDTNVPVITRVVVARKMTELATLLERREEMLRKLEVAHMKLAQKTLYAVERELDRREGRQMPEKSSSSFFRKDENEETPIEMAVDDEKLRERLIQTMRPFVEEFGLGSGAAKMSKTSIQRLCRLR
jgi:hypothetical protein